MKPKDRIYFLIDHYTEISGTVVTFNDISGKVVVRADDDGELLFGFEEHTRLIAAERDGKLDQPRIIEAGLEDLRARFGSDKVDLVRKVVTQCLVG